MSTARTAKEMNGQWSEDICLYSSGVAKETKILEDLGEDIIYSEGKDTMERSLLTLEMENRTFFLLVPNVASKDTAPA